MQWPTMVLVFPLFPTLLGLIKKRAPPYPPAIAPSDIHSSYSPYISSKTYCTQGEIIFPRVHNLRPVLFLILVSCPIFVLPTEKMVLLKPQFYLWKHQINFSSLSKFHRGLKPNQTKILVALTRFNHRYTRDSRYFSLLYLVRLFACKLKMTPWPQTKILVALPRLNHRYTGDSIVLLPLIFSSSFRL
jgi:hypothetical protein